MGLRKLVGRRIVLVWQVKDRVNDIIGEVKDVSDDFITVEDDYGNTATVNRDRITHIKQKSDTK